jgi:hypothetical protein
MKKLRLILFFWKWPKAVSKLCRIRSLTSIYYNDSKHKRITKIIDE